MKEYKMLADKNLLKTWDDSIQEVYSKRLKLNPTEGYSKQ